MNTETKELMDMDSDLFKRLDPEEQEEFEELPESLEEMRQTQKRLDRLEKKIDRIFGSHSLIDGEWVDTSNFAGGN